MGQIATMLTSVTRTRSPLQKELDSLTKVLGVIAWTAVAIIVVVGLIRGLSGIEVLLLGTAMAISAIPTGLPTFVSAMLSYGAKQLAEAKAVVKNLTDVETLGATSAINTDKTGTLTMNQMMVSVLYAGGSWFTVEGEGYAKSGRILSAAGVPTPDFTRLAYGLALDSDATVSDDGAVVGDPTEAALVVLAAKLGVDAEETRRAYPRLAEVPFDSEYKFMATFHRVPTDGGERLIELVKGAPDVVLARCSSEGSPLSGSQVPIDEARAGIEAANEEMGEKGLRVLAFAVRLVDDADLGAVTDDPMSFTQDLSFVAMVGIIDPLRSEAKDAVQIALGAGIDVRMITGDHAVTAKAIGETLGLGAGAISGAELQAMSDEELARQLPDLHVFGRVSPEDKLRLARLMQQEGLIVAMTGDAVNDAAALKQADIGVAMGSGSEVSKQAARMILTDDNFGTLVHAVQLGRTIYSKVVSYVRYQMTQLLSLVLLFLAATAFDINSGVAMTPLMVLFLNFFISVFPVMVIMVDPGDPEVMHRPPRDPKVPITNRAAVMRWVLYGGVLFLAGLVPLVAGPDDLFTDAPSASMTMCFVVIGLGTIFSGLVIRREPSSGLTPPILSAVKILVIPTALLVLATELEFMQKGLLTQPLTGLQWLACIGLALVVPIVVEVDKWIRRRQQPAPAPLDPAGVVNPGRAVAAACRQWVGDAPRSRLNARLNASARPGSSPGPRLLPRPRRRRRSSSPRCSPRGAGDRPPRRRSSTDDSSAIGVAGAGDPSSAQRICVPYCWSSPAATARRSSRYARSPLLACPSSAAVATARAPAVAGRDRGRRAGRSPTPRSIRPRPRGRTRPAVLLEDLRQPLGTCGVVVRRHLAGLLGLVLLHHGEEVIAQLRLGDGRGLGDGMCRRCCHRRRSSTPATLPPGRGGLHVRLDHRARAQPVRSKIRSKSLRHVAP